MPLTNADDLSQWLATRLWLDVEQTGTELLEQLGCLDQTPLAADLRARLLELYHPYIAQLTESLEKKLLTAALPLSPANRETAGQLLKLCQQMISNLGRIIFSPEFSASNRLPTDDRLNLLLRITYWLAMLGLHYTQIYHPPSVNYWETVYRIYELLNTGHIFPSDSKEHALIQGNLARILLFNIATPQRYRPEELKQIDLFLQNFSHRVIFHHQPAIGANKAVFFFDPHTPAPPHPIKLVGQVLSPSTSLIFLFPQPLTKALLQFVTSSESQNETFLPLNRSKKLAMQLARILSAPKRRKWKRLEEKKDCQIVVGIPQLLSVLIAQNKIADDLFEMLHAEKRNREIDGIFQDHFEILPLEDEMTAFDDDRRSEAGIFWDIEGSRRKITHQEIWSTENSTINDLSKQRTFPGRMANVSAQGYCLLWIDHTPNVLKVGEIIGIVHTLGEIEIGAVRWLKRNVKSAISVGVELLSFAVTGVAVYQHLGKRDQLRQKCELGLLLPIQPALKKPAGLLVPSNSWRQGQWVRIYRDKSNHESYTLKQLADSTPAYDLFALERIS